MKKAYIGGRWDATTAAWAAFQNSPRYEEIVELLSKAKDADDLIQASWCIGFAYALEIYDSGTNDN